MKTLSVVIPTYNMEKYLANCLDSFIYDKYTNDIEVLIVNDGSKDNSLAIAKEYELKYPNIFKVIDKENGGHGSTINAGLKVATGKYFKVVDADDWVDTEEFKKLIEYIKDLEVDCICTDHNRIYEQENKIEKVDMCSDKSTNIINIEELESFEFSMHSLTFKTNVIRDIRLTEHCFYVDVEYNLFSFAKCETLKYIPLNVYQYRLGRVGQSVSPQGFFKHRDNRLTVCHNIIDFLETFDKSSNKYKLLFQEVVSIVKIYYADYILICKFDSVVEQELRDFDEWLKKYPELYNESNKNKTIRNLRKNNFKNLKSCYRIHKLKQFIKKIIRKK